MDNGKTLVEAAAMLRSREPVTRQELLDLGLSTKDIYKVMKGLERCGEMINRDVVDGEPVFHIVGWDSSTESKTLVPTEASRQYVRDLIAMDGRTLEEIAAAAGCSVRDVEVMTGLN